MKAILKKPGELPELIEIENDLKEIQKVIGGKIESLTFAEDACVLCDRDGVIKGLQHNTEFLGNQFVGTILLVGVDGDCFCDFPVIDSWLDLLSV